MTLDAQRRIVKKPKWRSRNDGGSAESLDQRQGRGAFSNFAVSSASSFSPQAQGHLVSSRVSPSRQRPRRRERCLSPRFDVLLNQLSALYPSLSPSLSDTTTSTTRTTPLVSSPFLS
jgi:hypothetical protein